MAHVVTWTDGKRKVTGYWQYNWSSDSFTIQLDEKDETTGLSKCFKVYGEKPEWGNWKRIKST